MADFRGRGYAPAPEVFYANRHAGDEMKTAAIDEPKRAILDARVVANRPLCREHRLLTLRVPSLPPAVAGQFVHINAAVTPQREYRDVDWPAGKPSETWQRGVAAPMLRRAFSIAGVRRGDDGVEVDVIYRVVGAGTRWMESLARGDVVSMLAPLGNGFPIDASKRAAWLVAGGVGLPPMLFAARSLVAAGIGPVAFYGAQSRDLIALSLDPATPPSTSAAEARRCAVEFSECDTPVVISTDDGSLGFAGHVGAAMAAYHGANPLPADQLVVYTCGPERMMRFVAEYCVQRKIECHVCMERAMACGTGTCQSCVVEIADDGAPDGWRYDLCCMQGPVFDARDVLWEPVTKA